MSPTSTCEKSWLHCDCTTKQGHRYTVHGTAHAHDDVRYYTVGTDSSIDSTHDKDGQQYTVRLGRKIPRHSGQTHQGESSYCIKPSPVQRRVDRSCHSSRWRLGCLAEVWCDDSSHPSLTFRLVWKLVASRYMSTLGRRSGRTFSGGGRILSM